MKATFLSTAVALLAFSANEGRSENSAIPADFFYFARDQREVEVPFGLGTKCSGRVYLDPYRGLSIEGVQVDGQALAPMETRIAYAHKRIDFFVSPGASFHYKIPLSDLYTYAADVDSSRVGRLYRLDGKRTPSVIEISYRVRCPDGSAGPVQVSRGLLLSLVEVDGRTTGTPGRR